MHAQALVSGRNEQDGARGGWGLSLALELLFLTEIGQKEAGQCWDALLSLPHSAHCCCIHQCSQRSWVLCKVLEILLNSFLDPFFFFKYQ